MLGCNLCGVCSPISVKTRKLVLHRTSNCNVRYATLRIVRAISALIAHGDSTSPTIRNWSVTRASDATASWSASLEPLIMIEPMVPVVVLASSVTTLMHCVHACIVVLQFSC